MRFEDLTADRVRQLGSEADWSKARELLERGLLHYRYRAGDRLEGAILENDQWYPVTVTIVDGELQASCSCPHEGPGWCPGSLALLAAWLEEPESFLDRAQLREHLRQYSKGELVKIILEMADKVYASRELLKAESPDLDTILETIDQIVAEAAGLSDSELRERMRSAQEKADRLAEMGRLSEARATYFYLLDNIYGLEEELQKPGLFPEDFKQELFEEYCQLIHEDRHLDRSLVQQEIEQLESREAFRASAMSFSELKQRFFQESEA